MVTRIAVGSSIMDYECHSPTTPADSTEKATTSTVRPHNGAYSSNSLSGLATELQIYIFQRLDNMWSVVALRLTCRHLNRVYLGHVDRIRPILINRIVGLFYDYFDFLVRLILPKDAILRPLPSGWPNIRVQNREDLTEVGLLVFDVLSHLPAIDYQRAGHTTDYKSHYRLGPHINSGNLEVKRWEKAPQIPMQGCNGPEVMIAEGHESGGVHLYLDVMVGAIREDINRIELGGRGAVKDYLARKTEMYENLDAIFHPVLDEEFRTSEHEHTEPYDAATMEVRGEPVIESDFGYECEEDYLWLRHLYRKFGWPEESWRKEEALRAIDDYAGRCEYVNRRNG
jgi:hypothetical protein